MQWRAKGEVDVRQLIGTNDGVRLVRLPVPSIGPNEVLVRVRYSLVSTGTETAPYKAMLDAAQQPIRKRLKSKAETAARYARLSVKYPGKAVERLGLIAKKRLGAAKPNPAQNGAASVDLYDQGWSLGYSCAGEVAAVGESITDIEVGDLVACAGAGVANHAEYVGVPRRLVARVPGGVSLDAAAMTTVASIALNGVRRAAPNIGDVVAVIGLGLIGQMTAQMLVANGCTVVGFDPVENRVSRAKSLGMQSGTSDPDAMKPLIDDATDGWGADVVIIAASTPGDGPVAMATESARRRGVVVLVGDVGLRFERQPFYTKELDVRMSTSYGPGRYDRSYEKDGRDYPLPYVRWTMNRNMDACLDMMASGRLNLDDLVDERIGIEDAPEAYKRLASGDAASPIGVLLVYPSLSEDQNLSGRLDLRPLASRDIAGKRGLALVGVGAFGVSMLLPLFEKSAPNIELRAVVSSDPLRGGNFARQKEVSIVATEVKELVGDDAIDLYVLVSRHNLHSKQVIACINAGRHVFVEKPLAIDWQSMSAVRDAYDALESPPLLMVGFNRRFSPACALLRELLSERRSPMTMSYRVNAGYIPPEHWVQGVEGGGRNIGEACHMYDTLRFLAGTAVRSVSADTVAPSSSTILKSDNFNASLCFEDGSMGHVLYTALGPRSGMPKERLEIFCDGDAFILDDFKSLTRASTGEVLWSDSIGDKGHANEVAAFLAAYMAGSPSPIPIEEIFEVTEISLLVEDLIHHRIQE